MPCGRLQETACTCTGSVATSVLNDNSLTAENRWCSPSGLCGGLATLYPKTKMLLITQGLADLMMRRRWARHVERREEEKSKCMIFVGNLRRKGLAQVRTAFGRLW